jgi:hypothetical protein
LSWQGGNDTICHSFAFTPGAIGIFEQYQSEGSIVVCYDQSAPQFDNVIFDRRLKNTSGREQNANGNISK